MRSSFYKILRIIMVCSLLLCMMSLFGACKKGDSASTSDSLEDSSDDQSIITDTVAPVVTINGATSFTLNAGETLTLPEANATDDADGDLTEGIKILSASGNKFCTISDGKFTSVVGGTYEVLYCAVDAAGNDAFESVYITVNALTDEKELDGEHDLSVLDNQETFVENFAEGAQSPLLKDSFRDYYTLTATDEAISGNSLIIDYNKTDSTHGNKIYLSNLTPYFKTGIWSISFDVKLISGEAFDNFYVAYSLTSDAAMSYGRKCSLIGMKAGDVKHVEFTTAIGIEDENEGRAVLYIYNVVPTMNAKIALDNFVIKRENLAHDAYSPTIEELEDGFTYTWQENANTALGVPEKVSDITDSAAKNAISKSSEFSGTAKRLYASSRLFGLASSINPDYFTVGRVYTIRIPYYQKAGEAASYLTVVNGTANNRTIGVNIFNRVGQVAVYELKYIIQSGEQELVIYNENNWNNLWIGNITITLSDRQDVDVEKDYYTPTAEEMANGYVYTLSEGNVPEIVPEIGSAEYYLKETGNVPESGIDLTNDIFGGKYVLRIAGNSGFKISAFDGRITKNGYYQVSFDAYSKEGYDVSKLHLLILDGNNTQLNTGIERFCMNYKGNGVYTFECTIKGRENGRYLTIYSESECLFYIGSIKISASDESPVKYVSKAELESENGYTIDFDSERLYLDSTTVNLSLNVVKEGSDGYLHVTNAASVSVLSLRSYEGIFEESKTYTVTIKLKKGATIPSDFLLAQRDENGVQKGAHSVFAKTSDTEYDEYAVTFTANSGMAFVAIHCNGNLDFNIKSVNIQKND